MRTCTLIPTLLLAVPALLVAQIANQPGSKTMVKMPNSAQAVHRSSLVIDTHADTPQRFVDEHFDLADPLQGGELNLESMHEGNLGAEFFAILADPISY